MVDLLVSFEVAVDFVTDAPHEALNGLLLLFLSLLYETFVVVKPMNRQ